MSARASARFCILIVSAVPSNRMASSAPPRDSLELHLEELMDEGQSQTNAGDARPLTPVDPSVQPARKRLRGADLFTDLLKGLRYSFMQFHCTSSQSFVATRSGFVRSPTCKMSMQPILQLRPQFHHLLVNKASWKWLMLMNVMAWNASDISPAMHRSCWSWRSSSLTWTVRTTCQATCKHLLCAC